MSKRQIISREVLKQMTPQEVMDAYRCGRLDVLLRHGVGGEVDALTAGAIALVESQEAAFGVQRAHMRSFGGRTVKIIRQPVADLDAKIEATKRALQ